jgi:MmyB-like transcription regulator ligand binding domain
VFLHRAARTLFSSWDRAARGSVAHLHAVAGADPNSPELAALVGELIVKSPEFADLWPRHDVRIRRSEDKLLHHPPVGPLTLSYEVFSPLHNDGQRLAIYQAAPGSPSHDALKLLSLASVMTG